MEEEDWKKRPRELKIEKDSPEFPSSPVFPLLMIPPTKMVEKPGDPTVKPRFFKVLICGFEEKMEFPRLFLKHIIHEKYEIATILSPLGKPWHIKIQGDITNLYFGEGWKEFAEAHDLHIGYFLLFCYEGSMVFSMTVYDHSCCNKQYTPLDVGEGAKNKKIKIEDQSSEDVVGAGIRRDQNPEVAVRKSVKNKEIKRGDQKRENVVGEGVKKKIRRKNQNPEVVAKNFTRQPGTRCNGQKMAETSKLLTDSLPKKAAATYRITLRPRNLQGHYYLYIPVTFKEDTGISKENQLILRDPKGHLWTVDILHSTKNRTLLVKGWKEFCVKNMLKPGDECEFQLASDSERKKIMQVNIFKNLAREPAIETPKTSGTSSSGGTRWFWLTVTSYGLQQDHIQIPNAFRAATNMSEKSQVTLRDQEGRLFPVGLLHTTRNRTLVTSGWRKFSMSNKLEPGDVCEFRPAIDFEENNIFQVHIVKKSTGLK